MRLRTYYQEAATKYGGGGGGGGGAVEHPKLCPSVGSQCWFQQWRIQDLGKGVLKNFLLIFSLY